jgi:hypothetical protein
MDRLLRLLRIKPSSAARQAEERIRKADAAITQTVARRKASKATATVTACALIALMAPGCAAVKGWLAGGPEIELSAAVGPAKIGITLNPGKTVADAATALANAGESLAAVTGAIDPVPAE